MFAIEVFGESAAMATVAEVLDDLDGVSRVRQVDATRAGHSVVSAAVRPRTVDALLSELRRVGVSAEDTTIARVEVVEWTATRAAKTTLVWADVLGQAWVNSRPIGRYLALMFVAGVIACYGVTDRNVILIVGAMAVSPDLLPITAIGVSIVGRRPRLAGEALLTLVVGMAVTSAAAALFAFAQNQLGLIPAGFSLASASTTLGGLTQVNDETIVVAFFAGVAGMLALETRASSAVGVAVSVTTIPAAAYLGVAAGIGEVGTAVGALGVLGMNVATMAVGASCALVVQRALKGRTLTLRKGPAPGYPSTSGGSLEASGRDPRQDRGSRKRAQEDSNL
jgi:uncharacterized hydrophobic protein (TIGR00271 family)